MKLFKFFSELFKPKTKVVKVNPIKPTLPKKEMVKKVEPEEKDDKCRMCGGYSGNYILCSTCTVLISVG